MEEKLGKEWYQEVNKQPTILSQIVYSESDPIVMKNNTLSMKNSMKKYYHHLISDSWATKSHEGKKWNETDSLISSHEKYRGKNS